MMWAPVTLQHVQEIVADYLWEVYQHIRASISASCGMTAHEQWNDTAIDFFFSIPNTWRGEDICQDFRKVVGRAGYGIPDKHRVVLGLTEAEAATVAFLANEQLASLETGDVILSVDIGTSSAELAFFELEKRFGRIGRQVGPAFRELGLGSDILDNKLRQLLFDRLTINGISNLRTFLPEDFGSQLIQWPFWDDLEAQFEHSLSLRVLGQDTYKIPLPGVSEEFDSNKLGVRNGQLIVTREELSPILNDTLQRISRLVNKALAGIDVQIKFAVVSGALATRSSIFSIIQERFHVLGTEVKSCHRSSLHIITGLFLHHSSKRRLQTLTAQESYGVIIQRQHPNERYPNQPGSADRQGHSPKHAIKWFIKRGTKIPNDESLKLAMERRVEPGDALQWGDVVICSNDPSLRDPGFIYSNPAITRALRIQLDFTDVPISQSVIRKPRPWNPISSESYTIKYKLHLSVGPVGDLQISATHGGRPIPWAAFWLPLDELQLGPQTQPEEHKTTPLGKGTGGSSKASSSRTRMSLDSFYSERGSITPSVGNVSHHRYYYRDDD
ncbi:hypothetical protein V8F20_002980 [Naviculisporaceae sp. PSN 640]